MKLPYTVGVFHLNRLNVTVQLVVGYDSYCWSRPNDADLPLIKIGADHDRWWKILDCIHHEAEEFCMIMNGLAFTPAYVDAINSTTYVFHFNHGEFIKTREEVSYFLSKVLPKLEKAWNKYKKETKA